MEQLPVAFGIDHASRCATRHGDDGDRLVACRAARRRRRTNEVQLRERLAKEQLRDRLRRRIVERERRGQLRLRPSRKPVAQLDRHQRVEAQLLERAIRGHRSGTRKAQHRRHFLTHPREERCLALVLRQGAQLLPQSGSRSGRAARAAERRPNQRPKQRRHLVGFAQLLLEPLQLDLNRHHGRMRSSHRFVEEL